MTNTIYHFNMKRKYTKYKEDIIASVRPKLDPKMVAVVNVVSDGVIDKIVDIVSGSKAEYIFK